MKSNVCYLYNENGIEDVLDEVEKTAKYNGFNGKQQLQLRLLAEELIGMIKVITGEYEAQFWIETGLSSCEIHMTLELLLEDDISEELSAITEANRQAQSLVGEIYEFLIKNMAAKESYGFKQGDSMSKASFKGLGTLNWSLNSYERVLSANQETDKLDLLSKSIIAKLSDDILVSARDNQAEIIIKKDFHQEDQMNNGK